MAVATLIDSSDTARAATAPPTNLTRFVHQLDQRPSLQFLFAFAIILALKWHTLGEPPVWDTAMGLFPAALTLVANNFDLLELLGMPSFMAGGPNTYATSPVTLITAVVLKATGGGSTSFAVLHLLHFAAAAYALVVLFAFAKPLFGRVPTALFCSAVLLFPVFSTQVGYMYFEIPLFLCAVGALRAWICHRFWSAVLWAAAAISVKHAGILVPATLVLATVLENRAPRVKVNRIFLILAPVAAIGAASVLLHRLATPVPGDAPPTLSLGHALLSLLYYIDRFLLNVPDLWGFFLAFLAALPLVGPGVWQALRDEPLAPVDRDSERQNSLILGYSGMLIVLFMLLFAVALPVVFRFPFVLPRYSVVIAPFLLLWFGHALTRLLSTRVPSIATVCFVMLSVLFAVNTNGVFYPLDINTDGPGNDPALTERSNAYRRLLNVQQQAIRAVQALPDDVPVFYGHYEHYLLSYPGLGFADAPISNGHNLYLESLEELIRDKPRPPCTYALYSYPWLGGDRILTLIAEAETDPDLSSETIEEYRDGRYVIALVRIQKVGAVCPR